MTTTDDIREAARERLFDAVLWEAIDTEAGTVVPRKRRTLKFAVALFVPVLVTVGVAVLKADGASGGAQDPSRFDPLSPRIEVQRESYVAYALSVSTVEEVQRLPHQAVPPIRVTTGEEGADNAGIEEVIEALANRGGVTTMLIGDGPEPSVDVWRSVARMADLEEVVIGCQVGAAGLRELRNAPRLRALGLSRPRQELTDEHALALLELVHLERLQLIYQRVASRTLAKLSGLPNLHSFYAEACSRDQGWIEALCRIKTIRWLGLCGLEYGPKSRGRLSADDLRALGSLPRLASLNLWRVDVAGGDFGLLPPSLVALHFGGAVPGEALRELLNRRHLRRLSLVELDVRGERVLSEVLPRSRVEQFRYGSQVPDHLWPVLERSPRLRRLGCHAGSDMGLFLERVLRCRGLEQLRLHSRIPTVAELRRLRDLPQLRRVVILDSEEGRGGELDLGRLREALGAHVDLIVRSRERRR